MDCSCTDLLLFQVSFILLKVLDADLLDVLDARHQLVMRLLGVLLKLSDFSLHVILGFCKLTAEPVHELPILLPYVVSGKHFDLGNLLIQVCIRGV